MKKIFILLLMSGFILTACSTKQKEKTTDSSTAEISSSQNSSNKTTSSKQTKKETNVDFSNDEVNLKITNVSTGKGMDDTDVVFIDFVAKNKSNFPVKAQDLFMNYITTYQKGIEFEVGNAFIDSGEPKYEEVNKLSQEVSPNEEVRASFIYQLTDTESPIELRYHDRNSDKILKTETYELN